MMNGVKINGLHLIAGIIISSVLFLPEFTVKENFPKIHLVDLFLPVLTIICFFNRKKIQFNNYYKLLIIICFYILITILINKSINSFRDYFEIYKVIKYGIIILFFSLIDLCAITKAWIKPVFVSYALINLMHFFNLFNCNDIILNYYNGGLNIEYFGVNSIGEPACKRMTGLATNPNNNAVIFAFFGAYFFPLQFRKKELLWFFSALTMVFLCQSRTFILAYIAIITVLTLMKTTRINFRQFIQFILLSSCSYLIAYALCSNFFEYPSYGNSLFKENIRHSGSVLGRLESWKLLFQMIQEKPILGHGPYKDFFYSNNLYSENEYILFTWRYGIIGLIAYLLLYLIPLKHYFTRKSDESLTYLFIIIILLLVTAITNNPLSNPTILILYGAAIGLSFHKNSGQIVLND